MKILLTGATGFIGSHVARHLVRAGHEVHALVRPQSDRSRLADIEHALLFQVGDLLAPADRFVACPVCIHLAWDVEPGKYVNAPVNLEYARASLEFARAVQRAGCRRFVAAGTCFEYDFTRPADRISETHPTHPNTLYGQAKLQLCHSLQQLDLPLAWVRFFYQYGPHEDPRRLVPHVIQSLLQGRPAELTAGEQVRDFLHVEDVAAAVVAVATSPLTGAVNIGSGQPITVAALTRRIGELIGRPELVRLGARPYAPDEPMRIVADNSRLLTGTGWRPQQDLATGLRQTIDWWRTQGRDR